MTQDKDLKRLIRARMDRTGESYTTARTHVVGRPRPPEATPPDDRAPSATDGYVYEVLPDGRWSARDPREPHLVGYGPTKRWAYDDSNSLWPELPPGVTRRAEVLVLVESSSGAWTARSTPNVKLTGKGSSSDEATTDLLRKLPGDTRFRRTLRFQQHADGRWSVRGNRYDRYADMVGWGETANDAEADLLAKEDDLDMMFQDPGDERLPGDDL